MFGANQPPAILMPPNPAGRQPLPFDAEAERLAAIDQGRK
jgi:hypothetical protein